MTVTPHALGIGVALPKQCWSNASLIQNFNIDSSPEWIESRTGITQRYICGEGESVTTLAAQAAQNALNNANIAASDVDLIIVATCTPTQYFPAVATQVQAALGCNALAYDINAACSGFLYGLNLVNQAIITGQAKTVLLIGAEQFSQLLDWADRTTCVLFGDGAGAVLFQAQEETSKGTKKGILGVKLGTNGSMGPALQTINGAIQMQGREVFKHAVRQMGTPDEDWMSNLGMTKDDINWVIPHQANARIIQAAAQQAGIPAEKVVLTVNQHANTSAASIPLAWHQAVVDGRIQQGHALYLQAFGAGFTWGEAIIKL